MELTQNLWERYGFTDNPYDTKALSLSKAAPLSVQDAYVERDISSSASRLLMNFLRNPGGGRMVVEGEPGVGKTTFVNYHRQLWESSKDHRLLSPLTEISVREEWGERDFLLSLLASLSARLRLEMGEKAFDKNKILRKITAITGVHVEKGHGFSGSISVIGTGGGFGRTSNSSVKVGEVTNDQLRELLSGLIALIQTRGFSGVVFHLDNLELLARRTPEKLRDFFENIRDVLQEPGAYFVFVGYEGMFQQVIIPLPRVRSIFFDTPVHLEPLSHEAVRKVMEKRYALLAVPRMQWIKPVDYDVVFYLYETFSGKIRYVMNAITSLISHLPDSYAQPLGLEDAQAGLHEIVFGELKRTLHGMELEVFLAAVRQRRFTNSSLAATMGKSKQQIQKYLKNWVDLCLAAHAEKEGRNQFYEVDPRFLVLNESPTNQENGNG
ncbi:hypothetical protein PDESU_05552 [Pontiella desulfatans]|uniref:Orc1-like AAA ATPase domain-containing protein n=1 Tax=Pontiella desulfatans TaxID=2750659 RepID=A0A6C2UAP2_PONDE|nr:hypothetical protein [Pontiella desulfatans]VGO16959.1 hypothetical protein PDESU_05552 [Pontiella desulfatans]